MSLPASAAAFANSVPVSCMPSPESPAKRITTRSRCFVSIDPTSDLVENEACRGRYQYGGTNPRPSARGSVDNDSFSLGSLPTRCALRDPENTKGPAIAEPDATRLGERYFLGSIFERNCFSPEAMITLS